MSKKISTFFITGLLLICPLFSQEALKSIEEDYYDFLSLYGEIERPTLGYRTLSDSVWEIDEISDHLWIDNNPAQKHTLFDFNNSDTNFFLKGIDQSVKYKVYGPEWFNSYNTKVPYGQNDGALWQGVGYNTSFTTGAHFEAFGFELNFKPQITFSQNKDFEHLPGVYGSEFSYFWAGNIDLVQRFGNTSYGQFDFGDSEARFNFYTFTIGFGTENPWLGPAQLNPMLGSNNAASYPKFDFGFKKTSIVIPGIDYYFGDFETRIWIGQLTESDYYDNDITNNNNLINGFNISFAPSFFNGLSFGATKICITKWGNNFWKYLNPFYNDNNWQDGPGEDQKASIYVDWLFPSAGLDIYAEIGMDDYTSEPVSNPFHTVIYTIGLKQAHRITKDIHGELCFEWNNFEMSQDFQLQWRYMGYYAHGSISQGYTQKGQMIGAGSGYFGNSQYLSYKLYYSKGFSKLYVHRNCPDMNFIYNQSIATSAAYDSEQYNHYYGANRTYLTIGLASTFLGIKNLSLSGDANYSLVFYNTYNKYLVGQYVHNFYLSTLIKYNF